MAKKIVVVDDSREFVELVQTMLEQAGYQVVPVVESLKARDVVRRERPDMVMLDIMMPGRSGWELLDVLQTDAATKDIPILIVTAAMVSMRVEQRALSDRGVGILPKPFSMEDLLKKVEAVIGQP